MSQCKKPINHTPGIDSPFRITLSKGIKVVIKYMYTYTGAQQIETTHTYTQSEKSRRNGGNKGGGVGTFVRVNRTAIFFFYQRNGISEGGDDMPLFTVRTAVFLNWSTPRTRKDISGFPFLRGSVHAREVYI